MLLWKKALNLKNEHTKLCDLKILENQAVPGSFTSGHEVSSYVSSKKNEQTKIKRLHTEGSISISIKDW